MLSPADLTPIRNPGLIRTVWQAVSTYMRGIGPQQDERNTSQTGQTLDGISRYVGNQFNQPGSDERTDVYADADDMDRLSPEVSVALDSIVDNVMTSDDGVQMSFQVVAKDKKVQAVIDQTVANCCLHTKVRPMIRNTIKYGDSFSEPVIDLTKQIINLKQLPPKTMWRNEDIYGNLLLGKPRYNGKKECLNERNSAAFEQTDADDQERVVAAFWPWQIIHTRLNWDGFSPYGRSLLRVTREVWKRLREVEESLIIGRITRDFLKLIYYIDTTGLGEAEKKKVISDVKAQALTRGRMDNRREAPYRTMTDFFVTSGYTTINGQPVQQQTKIDMLDPRNEGQHNIGDIEYLQKKLLSTLRVPPAHLGFEKEINAKATLTMQDVAFVRFCRNIQQIVGQSLEAVFDLALALAGIDPMEAEYRVVWPMLKSVDELTAAQAEQFRSMADGVYLENGVIDPTWIQENRLDMTPDEIEELQKRLDEQKQQEAQEQQQQAEVAHARNVELIKAKGAAGPGGGRGGAQPGEASQQKGGSLGTPKGKQNGKPSGQVQSAPQGQRHVSQEARFVYANPDLVAELMADDAADMPVPHGSPGQGYPVVNIHLHEGMVQANHEHHMDPHAVHVEPHMPVTIVRESDSKRQELEEMGRTAVQRTTDPEDVPVVNEAAIPATTVDPDLKLPPAPVDPPKEDDGCGCCDRCGPDCDGDCCEKCSMNGGS